MSVPNRLAWSPAFHSLVGAHSFLLGQAAYHYRPSCLRRSQQVRSLSVTPLLHEDISSKSSSSPSSNSSVKSSGTPSSDSKAGAEEKTSNRHQGPASVDSTAKDAPNQSLPPGWEENADYNIKKFSDLPHQYFGYNQHIKINEDFKESLRSIIWQFRAPIRYAFAYGSGVFGQKSSSGVSTDLSPHPHPPKAVEEWQKGGAKVIDFIFGVSHTQHWHSLNLAQNPHHYSGLRFMPNSSALVSWMQDGWGAGMYYNPFITVNGVMIKYGVVHLDTLARDLSNWDTLYLAGRLQKPVKILRDDPRIRLANQVNLISALRTALLMLPEKFTERQLYERIAGLSYMGDPRMSSMMASESPTKVSNIVGAQLPGFRQLYVPLIENLPNITFTDSRTPKTYGWEKNDAIRHTGTISHLEDVLGGEEGLSLSQDMDPTKRGNMVRRLPRAFREKVYYSYKKKFGIPGSAFDDILEETQDEDPQGFHRREGGDFERRIAEQSDLPEVMGDGVRKTVSWPSTMQTVKGIFTAGIGRSLKYVSEKRAKGKQKKQAAFDDGGEKRGQEKRAGKEDGSENSSKRSDSTN
ncbi:unnamed protein product [Zymoseptoria tritici ST99CH_1A5]|uniref:Phosphatidate cytidylyltransferase, mitochondrial n=1 Tax=Zymoseptoria tritici ST99CH_1A5 TaxID=1276529 RepID=A0A1Y6L436_ZYMTR|nr:unnamed protein product [Zymoseptoria tritici ST99CH_1A5]